jgi:peptide-methionine (S)-S-oxide reductase
MTDYATFAAGCFWGVEDVFMRLPGVLETAVGYTGGHTPNPDYRSVCTGTTGHAEVVELTFNPEQISYGQLLEVFWNSHNPTTLNRQGPDVGTQYRSAIFFHTPVQQQQALAMLDELSARQRYKQPVVTAIVAASQFYRAEEYHQQYNLKHGRSCALPQE